MTVRLIRIIAIGCLWLGQILPALPVNAQGQPQSQPQSQPQAGFVDRAGGRDYRIAVLLHADRAPGVGEVATLTLTATPLLDAPELHVEWIVPDGVELLNGAAVENAGAVAAGESVVQRRQIRFSAPGVYKIMAQAGYRLEPALSFAALGVLFFTVHADGTTTASDQDPNAKNYDRTIPTEILPGVSTAAVRAPNGDPCFQVSGRVMRWDRPSTPTGYGAPVQVPARYVRVDIREEDILFDDTYWEGTTDGEGRFSHSFCDDDGLFDDELEIYIVVYSEIDFNGYDVVKVEDDGIIDDVYEFESGVQKSKGGALVFNMDLRDDIQSEVMNIADAIFDAWMVWNDSGGARGGDAIFNGEAEVHYEPGEGQTGSFYNGYFLFGSNVFNNNDITIADDPSDPDAWDDSVIIHEWAHMADDYYGCDDNGGGPHFLDTLVQDLELSWGEGYPNYYQSAVKGLLSRPHPSFYMDINGAGTGGLIVDLETYDFTRAVSMNRPDLLSEFNEMAIAAMLWDLYDSNNDPRNPVTTPPGGPFDSVSHGHRMIQEVYTDLSFVSNGDWFDDTCTAFVYLWAWQNLGKPTDSATAEAITKNNGRSKVFFAPRSLAALTAALQPTAAMMPTSSFDAHANRNPSQIDPRWWQRLAFVVDNSASMAEYDKLGAVKTALKETVNDAFNANPKGIEVAVHTFNNGSSLLQPLIQGQFRSEGIYPFVDQITTVNTPDAGCLESTDTLNALRQGALGQTRGQVWLYTDTDGLMEKTSLVRSQLNRNQMRASIVLLDGCSTGGRRQSDLSGEEEDFLLVAADGSQKVGIVPYLLTALGTGGQFLYVNPGQLADASDVLRAQLANSAGAGKWSDYLSDSFTYRWDRLEPSEYQWIYSGILAPHGELSGPAQIPLPSNISILGMTIPVAEVHLDGYINTTPCHPGSPDLCHAVQQHLNILRKDLDWHYVAPGPKAASIEGVDAASAPDSTEQLRTGFYVDLYSGQHQEWFVISTEGFRSGNTADTPGPRRAYQVWLNTQTGEIRYLYDAVSSADAETAEISIRETWALGLPTSIVVSNQDRAGAVSGSGYKFTPAPPVSKRTYPVKADSLVERIGFLQTGYSGAFEPMVVTDPSGERVTCGNNGVTCYTIDNVPGDRMVQYIEVPNSAPGTWHAAIDASSPQATFTFSALAASDLRADSPSQRLRPSVGTTPLVVNLGRAVDGNRLTGWFQRPNGDRFSGDFTLYDDGEHGDGRAGDGLFAVPDYAAPGAGVAYLWVKGKVDGEDIERADPVPFNFQPLRVTAYSPEVSNNNQQMNLTFLVDNLSNHTLCFNSEAILPAGWSGVWPSPGCLLIPANESAQRTLVVTPDWPDAPSGQQAEVMVAFVEVGEGGIQADAVVDVTRRRAPAHIEFDARAANYKIKPDSTQPVPLLVTMADDQGYPVEDGTLVEVSVTAGTLVPVSEVDTASTASNQATLELIYGRGELLFYPPDAVGDVVAEAVWDDLVAPPLRDSITLHVVQPAADELTLAATPTNLYDGPTSSALVVTVQDEAGDPLANALVRVGVSDDAGTQGTIDGSMVITGTTDANGQLLATFAKTEGAIGTTYVRAELLLEADGNFEVKRRDSVQLFFEPSDNLPDDDPPPGGAGVKLPLIRR